MRCQAGSTEVRRRLVKKDKYEVGEMLICRLYRKDEEGNFNVNIRWLITKVEGNMITIQDIKDKENVRTVSETVIDKHFRYAYCSTCHSDQGTSISGNITIHYIFSALFLTGTLALSQTHRSAPHFPQQHLVRGMS